MKITSLQEYGMRCLVQLALGGRERPQTTTSIAQREGLSRDYVEKILFQLRKAGLVKSVRGINGGYTLSRDPRDIPIGDAIRALSEKPIRTNHVKNDLCGQFPGNKARCVHLTGCAVRVLWSQVIVRVFGALNQVPLSALIGTEDEVQQRLLEAFSKNENRNREKVEVSA
jgi:Rrf2 family protein